MSPLNMLLVFLEGLLAFISPCILPMLPIYLIYLSGKSAGQDLEGGQRKLVKNTLFFVLGFTIIFVLLGAGSTAIGRLLSEHKALLEKLGGIILIVMGIQMTGLLRLKFLNSEKRLPMPKKTGNAISSLLLGFAFSIGWSPCLGPFLGAALVTAGQTDTVFQGMLLLLLFSMGLAIPFILTSLLFEQLSGFFNWLKKHLNKVKIVSGLLLVLLGIFMLLGWFGYYAALFNG